MAKLLVYELNEVPWRVIDRYLERRPDSKLAEFLRDSATLTTRTGDSGELHPWTTWPTMHRGVANDEHGIRFINQDRSVGDGTPPIWELLTSASKTVGICGCLQTYPPMHNANTLFHIPDTFAPASDTIPSKYQNFQAVNLRLTGENKAVTKNVGLTDALRTIKIFRSGIKFKTAATLAQHLYKERSNPLNRALRATMQAHVAFDVFMDAMEKHRPDYAALFSNHVAGVMHRYWKYMFPEDFGYTLEDTEFDTFHSESIVKALDIFDTQLATLEEFAKLHGYDILIASSMGQEAVKRGEYIPELKLDDAGPLITGLGFEQHMKMNLAMQPDVAFEFTDVDSLNRFVEALPRLTDLKGIPVFRQRYPAQGRTLNLSTTRTNALGDGNLLIDGASVPLSELGFSLISRDKGTGYHQPEGIFIWRGPNQPHIQDRRVIDSCEYAPTILHVMGVERPGYMKDSILS